MEKYYEKKAIKNGAVRLCKKCKMKLSRYNTSDRCATCEKNSNIVHRQSLIRIVNEINGIS
jgi:hypothetical protein